MRRRFVRAGCVHRRRLVPNGPFHRRLMLDRIVAGSRRIVAGRRVVLSDAGAALVLDWARTSIRRMRVGLRHARLRRMCRGGGRRLRRCSRGFVRASRTGRFGHMRGRRRCRRVRGVRRSGGLRRRTVDAPRAGIRRRNGTSGRLRRGTVTATCSLMRSTGGALRSRRIGRSGRPLESVRGGGRVDAMRCARAHERIGNRTGPDLGNIWNPLSAREITQTLDAGCAPTPRADLPELGQATFIQDSPGHVQTLGDASRLRQRATGHPYRAAACG